jgi:hypothetical protein
MARRSNSATQPVGVRPRRGVLDDLAGIVDGANVKPARLRSSPACNLRTGLLVLAPEPVTEEASLIAVQCGGRPPLALAA